MSTEKIGVEAVWIDQSYVAGVNRYIALQQKATDTTEKSAKGMTGAYKGINSALKTLGVGFTMAAAANEVRKFVRDSLVEFKGFQTGMSEVFTLLPGITGPAMEQMSSQVLAASIEMGRLPQDVIPALYQALSASIPAANVFSFLDQASQTARAGVSTLETAVDTLTTVVNAYGSENITAQEASDLLFTAVKGGKTTFDQLGSSLFNVIPTAAALGLEFGNVTAAIAAMTAQGTPTAQATTQLRQLLIELSKEGMAAAVVFERIAGQSFVQFLDGGGNLQQALQLMEQAAGEAGLRLSDMFSSVEAGNAALSLTGAGTDKFRAELEATAVAMGATDVAAGQFADSLEVLEGRSGAAAAALKIAVGDALEPAYTWLLNVKIAALEGAVAWITYAEKAQLAISENIAAADTTDALTGVLEGMIKTATGMNLIETIMSGITGQTAELEEGIKNASIELIKNSGSWKEFEDTISSVEGVTSFWVDGLGNVRVEIRGLGTVILGTREELDDYIATTQAASFDTNFFNQAIGNLPPTLEQVAMAEELVVQETENAAAALLDFHQKTLMSSDTVVDFTGFIIDYATSIGVTSEELEGIAKSTGGFTDEQLTLTKVMVEARKRGEELRKEVELGNITSEEAALILQREFQERVEVANAALEQSKAVDEATESIQEETAAISPWIVAMQQAKSEMGGFFDQAFKSKNEIGLFTVAIEDLGQQFVTVGGLTGQQASDLSMLQSEYDKTKKALDEYRLGIKGAGDDEEERAEKIAELQTQLGTLAANMAPLQAVTGELVEINNEAVLNTQALNEALYEAAVAAEAPAGALATLGVDLGLMSEAEAQAFLKTAALQLKIQELGQQIAEGMPVADALADLDEFKARLDQDYRLIIATGNLDSTMQQVDLFDQKVTEFDGMEITVGFNVDTDEAVAELDTAGGKLAEKLGIAVGEAETQAESFETATGNAIADVIALKESFDENMTAVSTLTTDNMSTASTSVADSTGAMVTSTADNMGQLVSEVDTAMSNAVSAAESRVGEFVIVGANISQGMADGILSGQGAIVAAVNQVVAAAIATANTAAATESPSKHTTETGLDIAKGLSKGITQGTSGVEKAASHAATTAVSTMDIVVAEILKRWESRGGREDLNIAEGFDVGSMIAGLLNGMNTDIAALGEGLIEESLGQGITQGFTGLSDTIGDGLGTAFDVGVSDFLDSLDTGGFVESFNDLVFSFADDIQAPTEAVIDFALATGMYTEEQLAAVLVMAQAKARAVELQQAVEAGTMTSAEALQTLRDEFADLIKDANEAAIESTITVADRIEAMYERIGESLSTASGFGSAGSFFAGLFEERILDPLQAEIDGMSKETDKLAATITQQTGLFDLSQQNLTDAYYRALAQGNQGLADDILEYQALQEQRNAAEKEFAAQQERILELQRQQQELSFLQTQLDLLQTIQEAGLNPDDILGGITLGLDASLPDLIEAMNAAMQAIIEAADEELGIASPSKVFEEKGENVGESFMAGILSALDQQNQMMADTLVSSGPAVTSLQPEVYITSPTPQVIVQGGDSLVQNNDFGGNTIGSDTDAAIFQAKVREVISQEFSR